MNGMEALFSACNEVTTLRLEVDGEKAKADPVRRARVATTFIMVTEYRNSKSGWISLVLSREDQRKSLPKIGVTLQFNLTSVRRTGSRIQRARD